jgi:hypothetical protein
VSPEDVHRTEGEPNYRLTRIGAAMLQTLEWHPEASGDERVIIILTDPAAERGGLSFAGYDDDVDAALDLFEHMRALFRARGQDLILAPLGEG